MDLKPDRISCCVPFCRRTRADDGKGSWICGPHWRGVPPDIKSAVRSARKSYRRRFGNNSFWDYAPGSPNRLAAVEAWHAWKDAWEACKRAAVEGAAAIG